MNGAEWEMPVSGQYACSRGISLQAAAAADGMLTLSSTFSALLMINQRRRSRQTDELISFAKKWN